jgi:hypothetical protein
MIKATTNRHSGHTTGGLLKDLVLRKALVNQLHPSSSIHRKTLINTPKMTTDMIATTTDMRSIIMVPINIMI